MPRFANVYVAKFVFKVLLINFGDVRIIVFGLNDFLVISNAFHPFVPYTTRRESVVDVEASVKRSSIIPDPSIESDGFQVLIRRFHKLQLTQTYM